MDKRHNKLKLAVFFWSIGSVCAGPVMGQNTDGPGDPVDPAKVTVPAEPYPQAPANPRAPAASDGQRQVDQAVDLFTDGDAENGADASQEVQVGTYGQIDLHVKDLSLTKVLQLLSIQSQRNIIASRNVSGSVSADLYGVSFHEALDAILHTNGFDYQEKGSFIYVYTADEMKQIREEQRQQMTKVIRLNYLNAKDASAFVSPMLSEGGSIAISGEATPGFQPSVDDGGENSFAHPDTLILRDYSENVDQIAKVIKQLDTRPKQILIEATVLQAALTENNAFGVDFALFSDLEVENFTNPLSAVDDLISGQGEGGTKIDSGNALTSSVADDTIQNSSVKVGFLGNDAAVFVRALDSVTDTNVLATPKLLVLNRQKAHLHVGQNLGYLSTTQTETAQTQTVNFLDVGTELSVRPFIGEDQFIRMELNPSVSDGSTRNVNGTIIPDEQTSELTTNVIVRNAQTVVLGGLFKEDTTITKSQVPGLGDIPIIGNLGKAQDDNVQRSEVIFLIKPTIMKDRVLTKIGEKAVDAIQASRIGVRNGLLPWSNTKLTSTHLREAVQAIEAGENDKALWHVNLALHIEPTNVDALRLKAKLTGERLYLHDTSLLKDMVNDVVNEEMGLPRADPEGPGVPTSRPNVEDEIGDDQVQEIGRAIDNHGDLSQADAVAVAVPAPTPTPQDTQAQAPAPEDPALPTFTDDQRDRQIDQALAVYTADPGVDTVNVFDFIDAMTPDLTAFAGQPGSLQTPQAALTPEQAEQFDRALDSHDPPAPRFSEVDPDSVR